MNMLAKAGIDIMNKHNKTHNNALHVVCDRKFPQIVS